MPLTAEQVEEIKRQILEQTKHLPEERRKQIEEQINQMTPEQLELYVKQQMAQQPTQTTQQSVFRAIVSGEIPSKIIDQNKDAIAVLDIKPISKGHIIIIPKKPTTNANQLTTSCFTLAKKVAKKLSSKLKAQGTEIQTEFKFGEIIINVIPIYDKPLNIESPRNDASEKEIEEVYNQIKAIKKPEIIKMKTKPKKSTIIKLKRKIP